jgi:hypothetical protein
MSQNQQDAKAGKSATNVAGNLIHLSGNAFLAIFSAALALYWNNQYCNPHKTAVDSDGQDIQNKKSVQKKHKVARRTGATNSYGISPQTVSTPEISQSPKQMERGKPIVQLPNPLANVSGSLDDMARNLVEFRNRVLAPRLALRTDQTRSRDFVPPMSKSLQPDESAAPGEYVPDMDKSLPDAPIDEPEQLDDPDEYVPDMDKSLPNTPIDEQDQLDDPGEYVPDMDKSLPDAPIDEPEQLDDPGEYVPDIDKSLPNAPIDEQDQLDDPGEYVPDMDKSLPDAPINEQDQPDASGEFIPDMDKGLSDAPGTERLDDCGEAQELFVDTPGPSEVVPNMLKGLPMEEQGSPADESSQSTDIMLSPIQEDSSNDYPDPSSKTDDNSAELVSMEHISTSFGC